MRIARRTRGAEFDAFDAHVGPCRKAALLSKLADLYGESVEALEDALESQNARGFVDLSLRLRGVAKTRTCLACDLRDFFGPRKVVMKMPWQKMHGMVSKRRCVLRDGTMYVDAEDEELARLATKQALCSGETPEDLRRFQEEMNPDMLPMLVVGHAIDTLDLIEAIQRAAVPAPSACALGPLDRALFPDYINAILEKGELAGNTAWYELIAFLGRISGHDRANMRAFMQKHTRYKQWTQKHRTKEVENFIENSEKLFVKRAGSLLQQRVISKRGTMRAKRL